MLLGDKVPPSCVVLRQLVVDGIDQLRHDGCQVASRIVNGGHLLRPKPHEFGQILKASRPDLLLDVFHQSVAWFSLPKTPGTPYQGTQYACRHTLAMGPVVG